MFVFLRAHGVWLMVLVLSLLPLASTATAAPGGGKLEGYSGPSEEQWLVQVIRDELTQVPQIGLFSVFLRLWEASIAQGSGLRGPFRSVPVESAV